MQSHGSLADFNEGVVAGESMITNLTNLRELCTGGLSLYFASKHDQSPEALAAREADKNNPPPSNTAVRESIERAIRESRSGNPQN